MPPLFKFKKKTEQEMKSSQNLIPLKAIDSELILTPDNYLIQGIKVSALNLDLMSRLERKNLFQKYEGFLKSMYFDFQQETVSQPVDLKQYLASNTKQLEGTDNPYRRELLDDYIEYIRDKGTSRSVMQRQRYILFSEKIRGISKKHYDDAVHDLEKKRDHIVLGVKDLDLEVDPLTNVDILRYFHVLFNYEDALNVPITTEFMPEIIIGGKSN